MRKGIPSSRMWIAHNTSQEDGMPTDEIIIRLFCMVDDQFGSVNKRSDALLYPSEIVTIGLLFSLKGGRFRAFAPSRLSRTVFSASGSISSTRKRTY